MNKIEKELSISLFPHPYTHLLLNQRDKLSSF